jgi:hypothetical protein
MASEWDQTESNGVNRKQEAGMKDACDMHLTAAPLRPHTNDRCCRCLSAIILRTLRTTLDTGSTLVRTDVDKRIVRSHKVLVDIQAIHHSSMYPHTQLIQHRRPLQPVAHSNYASRVQRDGALCEQGVRQLLSSARNVCLMESGGRSFVFPS